MKRYIPAMARKAPVQCTSLLSTAEQHVLFLPLLTSRSCPPLGTSHRFLHTTSSSLKQQPTSTNTESPPCKPKSTKSPGRALPPRPPLLPASEIISKTLHGGGPGGQAINKTASNVQLIHVPTGVVVKAQPTRSRSQNMKIAQRLLADEVDVFRNGKESRRERVREILGKRKDRGERRRKAKYRARAENEEREEDLDEDEIEVLLEDNKADADMLESGQGHGQGPLHSSQTEHLSSPTGDGNAIQKASFSNELLKQFYKEVEKRKSQQR